jgi:hypothetical protein
MFIFVAFLFFVFLVCSITYGRRIISELLTFSDQSPKAGLSSSHTPVDTAVTIFSDLIKDGNQAIGKVQYLENGGVVASVSDGRILVTPKNPDLRPFLDKEENINKYNDSDYLVSDFPAQEYLWYFVGDFVEWESIENSSDKYLVVKPFLSSDEIRFRVNFEKSELFGRHITGFYADDNETRIIPDADNMSVDYITSNFRELSRDQVDNILTKDSVLLIFTVEELPDLARKDSKGNYLSDTVIVRTK